MTTTYRLRADELDPTFLEKVKAAFAHKMIEIQVMEADTTTHPKDPRAQAIGRLAAGKPKRYSKAELKRREKRMRALNEKRRAKRAAERRDETDDLLSDPARRERLLRAAADVAAGQNLVVPDQAQFR